MSTPRMSAEHTPGPWMSEHETPAYRAGKHHICVSFNGEFGQIELLSTVFGTSLEGAQSNARLIAAAPDLLAACKALLEVSLQGGAQARYQARADAIEAIAKAEGRKPDFLTHSERALIAAREEFRKK